MNNIKYFLLFIFLIPVNFAFAQDDDNYDPASFMPNQTNSSDLKFTENTKSKDFSKWTYNLNMGTSFSTGTFGSFLDIYTAPQINYNFSPKWQFSTGLLIMNSTLLNSSDDGKSINQTRAYIMNRVSYQVNEKLRISGEILYGMNQSPDGNLGTKKAEYYINFDAQYKINDSFSIGLRVSGTNMNNPYGYNNPFYSGFSPAPSYRSPFNY